MHQNSLRTVLLLIALLILLCLLLVSVRLAIRGWDRNDVTIKLSLADYAWSLSDYSLAVGYYREAYGTAVEGEARTEISNHLLLLAVEHWNNGDLQQGYKLCRQAQAIADGLNEEYRFDKICYSMKFELECKSDLCDEDRCAPYGWSCEP